ncbi:bifunctional proline dehydrogenase/L-glutamate gamma-semialdehyde dehydrogenase PutA [Nitratireductor sp. ZSWI3]|uniref:bifunctional proline dehydrogenase/L-glutamate gamma-semialdehyde dehydrogenase PutA n=1 Tax=Nitratireductor sp. ZSWI3 TaxID=2966359 RepID=UPI00214F8310|nr:bifunctional proline dehydrogenase/L-glutamate gamma-semialdehyde dehydrogenase PutA [Nitratireductor sp. ZSWI3]MCR4266222.1 bifunctional proline dehydrogenase/L-glutamate gamma-semialdehyde dehydrogenase PutA [Nitratireductor sp. ZSWI3]
MPRPASASLRTDIRAHYLADEATVLERLVGLADLSPSAREGISRDAADLVRAVRGSGDTHLMEAFLSEYGLSTREGVALMCLAEALLRVPDAETMDDLIRDKISPHDWSAHSGGSASIFVNASTWALMLTGRVLDDEGEGVEATLRGLVRRLGEPVIRKAVSKAMREMGEQFVLGRTIEEAMKRGQLLIAKGYSYSYDMLGEAARTEADALRYHKAYADAIAALRRSAGRDDIRANPGISVKLSALHPRYEETQKATMLPVMVERLKSLALAARDAQMGLNVDAEEADRLDLSLDVIEQVLSDPALAGWDGFGVVVQAYGLRASFVLDWLYDLATRLDRRIMVRLVKGAYWDTEIKRAQVMGLDGFPVFTRKVNTDVSYIACARKLIGMTDRIYPQFATHNAHTAAAILAMAPERAAFEFQRLHGMGEALHEAVRKRAGTRCRIYAPVGAHQDLLAYLVRRLLENGANSSFVHQIVDTSVSAETIASDPFAAVERQAVAANPAIQRPADIFGEARLNARGWDITDPVTLAAIEEARAPFSAPHRWRAGPMTRAAGDGAERPVVNPADISESVGSVRDATRRQVDEAVGLALAAQPSWAARPVSERAAILRRIADLYERQAPEFFALAAREAGKTLADGIAEVREAVDFLRYYAQEARHAEKGTEARGVIVCISPWNFPLAIFTGQIAAGLVTGNAVIAKPAEQTSLIAARAVALMHEAGVPADVIQLLTGDGPSVGGPLTADPRIAGVCFTGSTEVARLIERQLAANADPDAMLIAETGGLNAMIVDSTALPEQAVRDIVASAFQSAGQRCSALRMLYVQKDVEKRVTEMLEGAMRALTVGDPWRVATDVGPVIDDEALRNISAYAQEMTAKGRLIAALEAPNGGRHVAPAAFKVSGIGELEREVFGPILHVATFEADAIDDVISAVNAKGYGLTFGLHTRIDARAQHVVDHVHAGNIYVNRNQIGAVVGSQPFGGEGLSGTGPKAGGPHYLRRFRRAAETPHQAAPGGAALSAEVLEPLMPMLDEGWAQRADRLGVLRKLLRGKGQEAMAAAAALDQGPIDLPGPTGEANTLMLAPRGRVLCLGGDEDALLAEVIQALATGNAVLAVHPDASRILKPLLGQGLPLAAADGVASPEGLTRLPLDLVAASGGTAWLKVLRGALAGREGAVVPLVTETLYPAAYAHERAICVDTTAAGGNASLLAAV